MNKETIMTDVLVVGGGTSGCHAAIAAAREGVSVCMVEMDDAVGGVATRSNVSGYHFGSRGGLQDELDRKVMKRQKVFGGRQSLSHPEAKRSVYSEMLSEANVKVLLGYVCCDVIVEDGTVIGIVVAGPDGLKEIRASVTVDCTSEGDVSAAAGASYSTGRDLDGVTHAYSLTPRILDPHPKTGEPQISLRNFDAGWVDSVDMIDISRAYQEGRDLLLTFLTEGNGVGRHLISIAPKLGVREGRHVVGDYQMKIEDFLHDRKFDDVVVRAYSHYDTHARDLGNESDFAQIWLGVLDMFKQTGLWCDIPYRSLLPYGIEGLLTASRALSVDREVSMAVRMQRDIQKVGEAAGVAAAMSAKAHIVPRHLSVTALQQRLVELNVLKSTDLSRSTTSNLMFQSGPLAKQSLSYDEIVGMTGPSAKQLARQLCTYLATEEEAFALWWLSVIGPSAVEPVREVLGDLQNKQSKDRDHYALRRGAAFALALLGSKDAIPTLLEVLKKRDEHSKGHFRSLPRWVAAIILLRLLNCNEAVDEAMSALEDNVNAGISSILLSYLYHVCESLDTLEQRALTTRLKQWVARPEAGSYYTPADSNAVLHIRWVVVFWVGMILARCRDEDAASFCEPYLSDDHAIIRQAAVMASQKIAAELSDHRMAEEKETLT